MKLKRVPKKYINIEEMSRIGFISDVYEIYIHTDDPGDIPHFHIRKYRDWKKFHTCIKIESAEYFHHKRKQSILNSSMKKELQKFMRDINKFSNISNYEMIAQQWNINNSNKIVELQKDENGNIIVPDYINL